ncbi:MAG: hypothetical protein JNG84_13980, partial [Archangium sp.]|nr:hypothetical protein [Archangium sp.]
MRRFWFSLVLALAACSEPSLVDDAGLPAADAAVPTPCDSPEDCHVAGLSEVCRRDVCTAVAPCGDDLECGLGERCVAGQCRFTGCVSDDDCGTGTCVADAYSCVECGDDSDCPRDAPVCTAAKTCQRCVDDSQCHAPGPAHCSAEGACVHCTSNDHCPNGLRCGPDATCIGAQAMQPCPPEVTCGPGLACIQLNGDSFCLQACNLYSPASCPAGNICYRLTYAGGTSLVFEGEGPIGVCYLPQNGLRGVRESCTRSGTNSNCQPNLWCVPESASVSLCRSFCNPKASGVCPAGEACVGFYGDSNGREYGLCMTDNGFGTRCTVDTSCRAGQSCQPYDDPSASSNLSNVCQFNQGAGLGLAPCAAQTFTDGGVLPADRACRSGMCRADPLVRAPVVAPYFCYASCTTDSDCSIGTRTGVCEGSFSFTSPFGTTGTVLGCRPTCTSTASCAEYDAGVVCRARL